jgi:pilus assembly protein CpaB
MKNRRLGFALLIAVIVSLVITFLLYARVKHQFASRSATVKILALSKTADPGTSLTDDYLITVDWPANLPLEGSMTRKEDAIGRIVLYPIATREPLREQLLAAQGSGFGLTAKIPDGMRAVAVETNDVNNVSGFLFPGCHVDVLVTFKPDNGRDSMTSTVLQNIQVLSTGEKLQPDPSGKPQKVREVTMLLTPDDAQKLVLASNQGTVQFVLRNGSDQVQETRSPVELKQLQFGASAPAPVVVKRVAATTKPSNGFEVETYDGTKKSTVKF